MFHLKEIGLYEHITSYRMADLVELSLFPAGACSSAASYPNLPVIALIFPS